MKHQIITEKLRNLYDDDIVTEQILDDMLFEASMQLIYELTRRKDEPFRDYIDRIERDTDAKISKVDDRANMMRSAAIGGVAAGASTAITGAALYGMYKLIKKWTNKSKDPNASDAQKAQAKEKVASLKKKVATAKKAKK